MNSGSRKKVINGTRCRVIKGTHEGKPGIVQDMNTSKTGAITITVKQSNGERFKTLAKNVEAI
jgi:ribosomal protein S4E